MAKKPATKKVRTISRPEAFARIHDALAQEVGPASPALLKLLAASSVVGTVKPVRITDGETADGHSPVIVMITIGASLPGGRLEDLAEELGVLANGETIDSREYVDRKAARTAR